MLTISKAQIKYLMITDFSLISKAMDLNLTPMECRVWHYVNSCAAHGIEVDLFDATDYLEIEIVDFLAIAALLEYRSLIPNIETLGGTESV